MTSSIADTEQVGNPKVQNDDDVPVQISAAEEVPSPARFDAHELPEPDRVDQSQRKERSDGSKNRCQAYATVLGGFIYMLRLGSEYMSSSIAPYIASYYNVEIKQA